MDRVLFCAPCLQPTLDGDVCVRGKQHRDPFKNGQCDALGDCQIGLNVVGAPLAVPDGVAFNAQAWVCQGGGQSENKSS